MSLQEKSILINVILHGFSKSKGDASVTSGVLFNNAAAGDAGKWSTTLLPKHATQPISTIDGKIRKHHRTNTLPWSEKGARILPSANYENYMKTFRSLRRERDALIDAFRSCYPAYLNEARQSLGHLFRPENYPSADEAAAEFTLSLDATPVPHENDFRCQLGSPSDLSDIQDRLQKQVKHAESNARLDLLKRVLTPIAAMAEKLSDPDAKFRDTLVGNIVEITELIPNLNVTDDKVLSELHTRINKELTYYSPDALRHSPSDRRAAANKAQAIFDNAASWMNAA